MAQSSALPEKTLLTALEITLNTAGETSARISGATWFRHTPSKWRSPPSASTNMTNGTTAVRI
ncbi:MAG: hypothetical protein WBP81_20705 [Solirubrobacteraceae bacterium]